jgi:hypothetical protein
MFDIHTISPGMMIIAFWSLGALWYLAEKRVPGTLRVSNLKSIGVVFVLGLALWWYLPCHSELCSVERHLGFPAKVPGELSEADQATSDKVLENARNLYPQSLWVLQAELLYAARPDERLQIIRETSLRFPFQHPRNYLRWAELALALGENDDVEEAVALGLRYVPPDAKVNLGRRRGLSGEEYDDLIASLIATRTRLE